MADGDNSLVKGAGREPARVFPLFCRVAWYHADGIKCLLSSTELTEHGYAEQSLGPWLRVKGVIIS